MSNLKNRVQLIGFLGQDPEIKTFDGGSQMAKFSLATNDNYRNKAGEIVESTQWHSVVAWGPTASIVEKYLKRGNEVAIEGKLQNRSYEDKSGTKRTKTEVLADQIRIFRRTASPAKSGTEV